MGAAFLSMSGIAQPPSQTCSRIQPPKTVKANIHKDIISMQNSRKDKSLDSASPRAKKSDSAHKVLNFKTVAAVTELNYVNFDPTKIACMQAPVPKSKKLVEPISFKKPAPPIPQIQDVYMKSEPIIVDGVYLGGGKIFEKKQPLRPGPNVGGPPIEVIKKK